MSGTTQSENTSPDGALLEEAQGSYLRALKLAEERGAAADELSRLRKAALRQFLEQFRNFEGAGKLITEVGLTREDARAVVEELLGKPEFQSLRIFCYHKGKPSSRSMADQLRKFVATYLS